jgi:PAS domain S-box-containing protein
LLESLPEVVFQCDAGERFTYVNQAWERLLGHPSKEIMGRRFVDYIHPNDRAAWRGFPSRGEEDIDLELRLIHRTGILRWFRLTLRRADQSPRSGLAHDITERKELENQLLQAQKMEAIGRLAGGVAHDFNNLLTVITIASESAMAELAPGHLAREDMDAVLEASERASALTRQLLAFGRKQVMRYQRLSLGTLISEMLRMLSRLIGPNISVEVENNVDDDTVRLDPAHFQQVLLNLAVNARDAMPDGGALRFRIDPMPDADVPSLRLSVIDTGVGIAQDSLPHIFEPFYTTKDTGEGTGIGLALVYGIVQQSDGEIWAESAVGVGTRVHIRLPLQGQKPETIPVREETEATGGNESILVVDDDPLVRRLTCRALRRQGYTVEDVASGQEALDRLGAGSHGFSLIISDIMMPGMSGHALLDQLMKRSNTPKVMLMSGYDASGSSKKQKVPFLSKPFHPSRLLQKVREVLDEG